MINNNKAVPTNQKNIESVRRLVIFSIANSFFLLVMMAFILWWQDDISLLAFADGIWFVFAGQLMLSWSIFVYNMNIFTPLVHGVKTFFLMFVGQKPKEDYFTIYTKIKENQIPSAYIWMAFTFTLFSLGLGITLTLLAY
jgi:hypothetical protein